MATLRHFCLTFGTNSGYLFTILPFSRMASANYPHDQSDHLDSVDSSDAQSPSVLQRLKAFAGSTKAKVGAAFLGAVGAVNNADKADAAIMRMAEVVPGTQVNEVGDDEVGFGFQGNQLRLDNLDDANDQSVHWIGIRSNDATEADVALPLPTTDPDTSIVSPNEGLNDGITSPDLLIQGQLDSNEGYFVAVGAEENGQFVLGLSEFLENSTIYIGTTPLQGNPSNIDEAIGMTIGEVFQATIPGEVEPFDLFVVRPVGVPEPSPAALSAIAAGLLAQYRRRYPTDTK